MVHCHLEVAKGQYKGKWYKNSDGVYCLYNSIKFYDAFFMDDVELIKIDKNVIGKFKYLVSKDSEEVKALKSENESLKAEVGKLNKEIAKLITSIEELQDTINVQAEAMSVKEKTIIALKTKLSEINKLSEV